MSREAGRTPGQPLLVISGVLVGWIVLRALFWQSPFSNEVPRARPLEAIQPVIASGATGTVASAPVVEASIEGAAPRSPESAFSGWRAAQTSVGIVPHSFPVQPVALAAIPDRTAPLPAPADAEATIAAPGRMAEGPDGRVAGGKRWSVDTWVMMRNGSAGPLGAIAPSYGRSQAGGVLRYRIFRGSSHRPFVYSRITRTLAGAAETELGAGIAVRPVARFPLTVGAELRARDAAVAGQHMQMRPAVYAVTDLPTLALPHGLRGEAYAQAGYVGGRFATAFLDGQARVDAQLIDIAGKIMFRAGGGLWGGAQENASRLDIGPSASVGLVLGRTQARLAVDYRFRVMGHAAPRSGPALTISAGF